MVRKTPGTDDTMSYGNWRISCNLYNYTLYWVGQEVPSGFPNELLGQPNINSLNAFHGVRHMSEVNEKRKDMDLPSVSETSPYFACAFLKNKTKSVACVLYFFLVKFFN